MTESRQCSDFQVSQNLMSVTSENLLYLNTTLYGGGERERKRQRETDADGNSSIIL